MAIILNRIIHLIVERRRQVRASVQYASQDRRIPLQTGLALWHISLCTWAKRLSSDCGYGNNPQISQTLSKQLICLFHQKTITPRLQDKDILKINPNYTKHQQGHRMPSRWKLRRRSNTRWKKTKHFIQFSVHRVFVCERKASLTLRFIEQHHTAQQRREWQSEEGGVWVAVSSQKLQQEHQDWC